MFFLAQNLQASRVNLLMNDFAAGLPSPLAFLGLAAAISPLLPGVSRWEIGVIPILHHVAVSEGRTKPEAGLKDNKFSPIETPEDLIGSVTASLLLEIPNCSDEDVWEGLLAEALKGRRIAGGPIHNAKIDVTSARNDVSKLKLHNRGYALIPAEPPKSSVVSTGDITGLQRIRDVLYPSEFEAGAGRFVPVAVGHRLLEDPDQAPKRTGVRDPEIPHVFVEPAVGVAEFVSVRSKRWVELTADQLRHHCWRWRAEGEWILGHPNYHPHNRIEEFKESANG